MRKKYITEFLLTLVLIVTPVSDPFVTRVSAAESENATAGTSDNLDLNESGWDTVSEHIAALQNRMGQNINVITGYAIEVPTAVLRELAGKRTTLALHTGEGLTVSLTGTEIRSTDRTFRLMLSQEEVIPETVKRQVMENAIVAREFSMVEKELFPYRVNVHVSLGAEYAGKPAILYCYDEMSDTLQLTGIYSINEAGYAMFGVNRGDEYIAVVREGDAYVVKEGEHLGSIARRNRVPLKKLLAANPHIMNADVIYPGQVIIIP